MTKIKGKWLSSSEFARRQINRANRPRTQVFYNTPIGMSDEILHNSIDLSQALGGLTIEGQNIVASDGTIIGHLLEIPELPRERVWNGGNDEET